MDKKWSGNDLLAYFCKTAEVGSEPLALRTSNALTRGGIDTMEKLCQADEASLARMRYIGAKSLTYALSVRGMYLQSYKNQ